MVESTMYNTFFDIGLSEIPEKEFGQLRCFIYGNKKKKRVINNELVKRFFNNEELSKEEMIRLKKILDGSIYEERRHLFAHCKLCSDSFERTDLEKYSSKYKYWNLCIPTFPYFPGGMMIYLKDRKKLQIENLQDLPKEMFEELIIMQQDLYGDLKHDIFGEKIVGLNILFNQLSKSELCIHGHIEPMLMDIDKLDLGCTYVKTRPYDKFSSILNSRIDSSSIIKIPEGIKIPVQYVGIEDSKLLLEEYERILRYYFERGKKLRKNEIEILDDSDRMLYTNMVPAATNFVYLTNYRNQIMLSSVPELTLDFVKMNNITNDPADLYALSINRNYTNQDNVFMRNYSPMIRPSIKVYSEDKNNDKVLKLKKQIYEELEK